MNKQLKNVLILDDDEAVRESLADFFEDRGWQVMSAETAEIAIDMLRQGSPNGAVVDIRLPGMDGNEFIREVYRRNTSMACVLCTGSPEYDLPADLLKLSCVSNHVFRKPVTDMAELEKELLRFMAIINEMKVQND